MGASILSTYDMSITDADATENIYNELSSKYPTSFNTEFTFDLNRFESFRNCELNYFGPVIHLSSGQFHFYLTFLEFCFKVRTGKTTSLFIEFQIWGIINLKKEYPHTLIRTETFLDKIHEFIHPVELDFSDDEAFSKKYFVIANDKAKAETYLTPTFRRFILEIVIEDIIIEICGNQLIIGNKKVINNETAIAFANFLEKVSRVF